jgi:hypothetical protein
MKAKLFNLSHHTSHQEILQKMASDFYEEILEICKRTASYGLDEITINLEDLKTFKWVKDNHVYSHLDTILTREGLLKKLEFPNYSLSWSDGGITVFITARDLIQLGIKPDEQMGIILKELKTAKVNGEVANTKQAEIMWLKESLK